SIHRRDPRTAAQLTGVFSCPAPRNNLDSNVETTQNEEDIVSAPSTRPQEWSAREQPANGGADTSRQPSQAKRIAPQQLTGAQAVVRSLEELGVDVIFGIPGGAVLPVYDPLFDSQKLRHVLVRHEQGAGHAASGYAHATGRVGVC